MVGLKIVFISGSATYPALILNEVLNKDLGAGNRRVSYETH